MFLSKKDAFAAAGNEIERKFLMKSNDSTKFLEKLSEDQVYKEYITQVYIQKNEDYECRIRIITVPESYGVEFTKTEKIGNGLIRKELEESISEEEFDELNKKALCSLEKTRYTIAGTTMCFDVYKDGLVTMEIEFADLEHANAYDVFSNPLGDNVLGTEISLLVDKEITGDKTYSNYNLAMQGNGN